MAFLAENERVAPVNAAAGLWQLAHQPSDPQRFKLYVGGVRQVLGVHFLLADRTVRFLAGFFPPGEESVLADYPWDAMPAPLAQATQGLGQVTDHVARAQDRLLVQYKNKPLLLALVAALAGRTQVLETALWQIVTQRSLANALGAQLDGIGRLVGLDRSSVPGGSNDEIYRLWLRAQVLVNLSNGTIAELDAIIALTANPGTISTITEFAPASFLVRLAGVAQTQGSSIAAIVQKAKAAGVNATADYLAQTPAFGFDGATGFGFDAGYFGGSI